MGLFTKNDTLMSNNQQNITAMLDRTPNLKLGTRYVNGTQNMKEVPVLKVQEIKITQTDFRRLRDGEWLSDNTINPFLHNKSKM